MLKTSSAQHPLSGNMSYTQSLKFRQDGNEVARKALEQTWMVWNG